MARARSFIKAGAFAAITCAAVAAASLLVGRADAQQQANGWQLCNETRFVLEAATGRPDGRAILVQGWTRLRPGECRTAVAAPIARGTHYLYARTSSAHRGGRRQWGGDARLCVDPGRQFSIENPPQCQAMALEERRFRRVQINKRDSWRTSFSEATQFSLTRARAQGLQQLLTDAGYDIGEGRRGADPRRVAQAIAQFRAAARLAPNATEEQLIDALETAARRRGEQLGLTLCNRTRGRIWTAIARRRGDGFESRGWWPLNPGGCVRTIDDVLTQERYFVYASLETDEGPRLLAAGGEPFCTSNARFAVMGRDNCEARYYETAVFTPISPRNRGGLVVEFQDRDFLPPNERPRVSQPSLAPETPAPEAGRRGFAPQSAQPQERNGTP